MKAFYNEIDPWAAAWTRQLISDGLVSDGIVDERSIADLQADDLAGYRRVHCFAGISGWELALAFAGWPSDRPVWTGSCPCQPFSAIGKRKGKDDERHLWPEMLRLISECRPATVFGEQVASTDGREWLDGVQSDMEALGYSFGAADLCAACVGAPHIRQRLYWVGHSVCPGLEGHSWNVGQGRAEKEAGPDTKAGGCGNEGPCMDAMPVLRRVDMHDPRGACPRLRVPASGGLGDGPLWSEFEALPCEDGWRRVRPGTFPMAHGVPARVVRLRGYGNAIVPQVAALFIRAFMEAESE